MRHNTVSPSAERAGRARSDDRPRDRICRIHRQRVRKIGSADCADAARRCCGGNSASDRNKSASSITLFSQTASVISIF